MNFDSHSKAYRASLDPLKFLFEDFIGKPVTLLETGVYQGGSADWFLQNVLTHPLARYYGIDDSVRETAKQNLLPYGIKAYLWEADSKVLLPALAPDNWDILHVDGEHTWAGAFNDITFGWMLLRPGGLMLIDDYNRDDYGVRDAVATFHDCEHVEPCYKGYKIAFRKPTYG